MDQSFVALFRKRDIFWPSVQVVFQKIRAEEGCSFVVLRKKARYFHTAYHFHPELEITLITTGSGMRLVGDNIATYQPSDLVLLGSNLPHQYVSESRTGAHGSAGAVVIQFSSELLGELMEYAPEFQGIRRLLEGSERGYSFGVSTAEVASVLMQKLVTSIGLSRFTILLELLELLTKAEDRASIASPGYFATHGTTENQRINKILRHIHQNLDRPLRLEEMASYLKVSRASCNRLFQRALGKSFKSFLIEVRISQACKLLLETEQSILDIALQCGFTNLSNFNRLFRKLKNQTPLNYRRLKAEKGHPGAARVPAAD